MTDAPVKEVSSTRVRALVVEDEDIVRKILSAVLRDLGHEVLEAKDGEEAVALLTEQRVDLVITDKNLPGINGLAVLREARGRQPHAELMVVTGYASYESVLEALRLGARDYLEKPFLDLGAIAERVRVILDERTRTRLGLAQPTDLARALVDALEKRRQPGDLAALEHAQKALAALGGPSQG
jgi:CheY-like chemotaxis protein